MKNKENEYPGYIQYPEDVKKRVENVFAWTLEHNPYPESIRDRILWIHSMEKALKHIESESLLLSEIAQK